MQSYINPNDLTDAIDKMAQTNDANFIDADIPRNYIIAELEKIKCKRPRMLVDMGCGMAHIAMHFKDDRRFTIKSYDHIACDAALVEACDIAHMPLEDASVEIAVICLAMWGSNCNEYVAEAHRILETDGMLYVVEPTKRWTIADDMPGDRLKQLLTNNGFKIVRESIDKFARLVCVKV